MPRCMFTNEAGGGSLLEVLVFFRFFFLRGRGEVKINGESSSLLEWIFTYIGPD